MDPHVLTTFLAVRKHRNFTRAAEELGISQPAVSRQIQQLERELGMPVFDRLGKLLHVTEAGETLAEEGQKLLSDLQDIMEAVRRHASPGTGTLRIGAGTTPGLYLLPQALGAFCRKFPHVEVRYSIERSANIIEQVLRNEIDLGFVGCPVHERALVSDVIAQDEIVCFVAPRHAKARGAARLLDSLENETWIVRPPGSATRALVDSWLTANHHTLTRTIEIGCPEEDPGIGGGGSGPILYVHPRHRPGSPPAPTCPNASRGHAPEAFHLVHSARRQENLADGPRVSRTGEVLALEHTVRRARARRPIPRSCLQCRDRRLAR